MEWLLKPMLAKKHQSQGIELPKNFIAHTFSELTYAVIKCTLPTLTDAWNFASKWIARNGYKDISYDFGEYEVYPEHWKNEETDPMYIYVPVTKV